MFRYPHDTSFMIHHKMTFSVQHMFHNPESTNKRQMHPSHTGGYRSGYPIRGFPLLLVVLLDCSRGYVSLPYPGDGARSLPKEDSSKLISEQQ